MAYKPAQIERKITVIKRMSIIVRFHIIHFKIRVYNKITFLQKKIKYFPENLNPTKVVFLGNPTFVG